MTDEVAARPTRLLLLTLVFRPDAVSTAHLLGELIRQLHMRGHDILVVTTTPHYNVDRDAMESQPLWRSRALPLYRIYRSVFEGLPVWHVPMRKKGKRILGRALDYLLFHVLSTAVAWSLRDRYDVILVPSPPLTTGVAAALLACATGKRVVYNVQEIYPDVAIELGVLKNRFLIKMSRFLERFVYRHCDAIVVISERFRLRLLQRDVPKEKLWVIPNFAMDAPSNGPTPRRNRFSTTHGLDNAFVVLYAGNLGLTQDVETVVEAARALERYPEIKFLIVGDGVRRSWLEAELVRAALRNVMLLPYQDSHVVPDLYGSSDVCLVPLKAHMADTTFPSKIYTIMACERPAIVMAEEISDVGRLVVEAGCGWRVDPGDADGLAAAIEGALRDRVESHRMAMAGRGYMLRNHTAAAAAERYEEVIASVVGSG